MTHDYVEIGLRLYEVRVVESPLYHDGIRRKSVVDHDEQAILICDSVDPSERETVLLKAISAALGYPALQLRLVPMVGSIS